MDKHKIIIFVHVGCSGNIIGLRPTIISDLMFERSRPFFPPISIARASCRHYYDSSLAVAKAVIDAIAYILANFFEFSGARVTKVRRSRELKRRETEVIKRFPWKSR